MLNSPNTIQTIQVARLQVGDEGAIRLVVSTVAELEHLVPWLQECIKKGRDVINVVQVERLCIAKRGTETN